MSTRSGYFLNCDLFIVCYNKSWHVWFWHTSITGRSSIACCHNDIDLSFSFLTLAVWRTVATDVPLRLGVRPYFQGWIRIIGQCVYTFKGTVSSKIADAPPPCVQISDVIRELRSRFGGAPAIWGASAIWGCVSNLGVLLPWSSGLCGYLKRWLRYPQASVGCYIFLMFVTARTWQNTISWGLACQGEF